MLFPVVNILKCVVTKVLFFIVAFKTPDISQSRVASHFRCGGIFSDTVVLLFIHSFIIILIKNRQNAVE